MPVGDAQQRRPRIGQTVECHHRRHLDHLVDGQRIPLVTKAEGEDGDKVGVR